MRYLLDTNVLKEVGKRAPHRNVAAWLDTVDDNDLAISVISVREIWKGIEQQQTKNESLATTLERAAVGIFDAFEGRILGVDEAVARHWGRLLGQSEKHIDDTGLAAIAAVHGIIVVTRNVAHIKGRGVDVLNPFTKPAKLIKA